MTNRNHRIRFMENNFAEETGIAVTYSSQLTEFPATNCYQNKFRGKPWKPSGSFEITAANNKFYINDGSPKTATIVANKYSTPQALATQIQTQLNTVSSGWTVSYNAIAGSYKFRVSHASAHTIVFTNNTDAIWDTIGFTFVTDQIISTNLTANEQRNHTSEWLRFDFGTQQLVTFFGLISQLDTVFSISSTATIKLQANNLDVWTSPPLDLSLTREDQGILKFIDDLNDTAYRYWRFSFADKLNPLGPEGFSFGYLYLGDYLTFDDRNIFNGFQKQINDPSTQVETESGVLYFTNKKRYAVLSASTIGFLAKDQRDLMEQFFYDYGKTTPFFISYDPTLCFSNNPSDFTKFVVFESSPTFTHVIYDKFNINISFREIL
jgi:hypothetical protein